MVYLEPFPNVCAGAMSLIYYGTFLLWSIRALIFTGLISVTSQEEGSQGNRPTTMWIDWATRNESFFLSDIFNALLVLFFVVVNS